MCVSVCVRVCVSLEVLGKGRLSAVIVPPEARMHVDWQAPGDGKREECEDVTFEQRLKETT